MGLLADAFVATDAEIAALDDDALPIEVFGGIDVKGIDVVKAAHLAAIVLGVSFEDALEHIEEGRVYSDDGPWIVRFSVPFSSALAQASGSERLASFAAEWGACEEFEMDGWPPEAVHEALTGIAALATTAQARGKRVYLWNCL